MQGRGNSWPLIPAVARDWVCLGQDKISLASQGPSKPGAGLPEAKDTARGVKLILHERWSVAHSSTLGWKKCRERYPHPSACASWSKRGPKPACEDPAQILGAKSMNIKLLRVLRPIPSPNR